jgi:hypothetical protein
MFDSMLWSTVSGFRKPVLYSAQFGFVPGAKGFGGSVSRAMWLMVVQVSVVNSSVVRVKYEVGADVVGKPGYVEIVPTG